VAEPSVPRRKPLFPEETLSLRDVLASKFTSDTLEKRPTSRLGREGQTLGLPIDVGAGGDVFGGFTAPMGANIGVVQKLMDRRAIPREDNLVGISKSFLPKDKDLNSLRTIFHEFRHRGINILKASGFKLPKIKYRGRTIPISEEVMVRLLDEATLKHTESQRMSTDRLLDKALGKKRPSVQELLANPRVLGGLMLIQKESAGLLMEQGMKTPINFPSDEALTRNLDPSFMDIVMGRSERFQN